MFTVMEYKEVSILRNLKLEIGYHSLLYLKDFTLMSEIEISFVNFY